MKPFLALISFLTIAALVMAALPTGKVFAADDGWDTYKKMVGPVTSNVVLTPNPATLNATITITADVDDTTTGNAVIQSAAFSVNGGAWTAMTASDGLFDTVTENVIGTWITTSIGTYNICVRGTDALNKVGKPACAPLTVQSLYTFTGFKSPIKMGKANKANAPQTIPIKWNLTLTSDGTYVTNPASFVAVKSYAVDCTTLLGDITTAVVEKSPGKTTLTYLGAGNWKFNWKTIKDYRHTCRSMFVLFSDGAISPQVLFSFK